MHSNYYYIILFLLLSDFCILQSNIKQSQWDNKKSPQARVNNLNEEQINEFLSPLNKGTYSISTSTMTVEFYNEKGGFAVSQIKLMNSTLSNSHYFMLPWTIEYSQYPTLWQFEIIGQEGLQTYYDSASTSLKEVLVNTKDQLTFQYNLTNIQYVVNCTILSINDSLEFYIDIVRDKDSLQCLDYVYYPMIEGIGSIIPANDTFFYPVNYGQVFNNPGHMGIQFPGSFYPSTYTSFQYMSYYHNNQSGIYLGAHDPHASTKNFYFSSDSYRGRDSFHLPHSSMGIFNYPSNMCVKAENSNSLSLQYKIPYPIILQGFRGSWWDAAQIYREWVIPNADWTQKGPIKTRSDFPEWYIDNTLWVNTNWLPGVLNCTLGDPSFVLDAVLQAYNSLNIPFAVHWYCWEFYPFDTNYPDYLPAKSGFQETINELHEYQIKILPYINGRLYDVNAPSYNQDLSGLFHSKRNVNNTGITYDSCVKASAPRMNNRTPIQVIESYASGQFFAVMCPYTEYWQSVLTNKVEEIVLNYNTDGLYIDQIGAAPPYLCADPSHGHPTLGGSYWAEGYSKLLDQMTEKNGNERIFITEENAESYMGSVQGFLSLSPYSECNMVPAWMTIYGGYQMSVGRTFTDFDLMHEGEGFSFKMGQMFIYGAQMGWFALSGTDGFGNVLFTNPNYKPVLNYVVSLTKYRLLAKEFLIYGRLLRPLEMYVGSNTSVIANFCLPMPITQSSVWESDNSTDALPFIAALFTNTSPHYNDTLNTSIDLTLYPVLPDKAYRVTQYNDDGSSSLFGVFNYPTITIATPLPLLSTLYLIITAA